MKPTETPGPTDLLFFLHIPRTGATAFYELVASRLPAGTALHAEGAVEIVDALKGMDAERIAALRLLGGHYDPSVASRLGRRPRWLTMLREPAARTMSRYEFIRATPAHPLHREASRLSFLEFLQRPGGGMVDADGQTRQIAGVAGRPRHGSGASLPGPALLEIAKEQIEDFRFVGLRERPEESAELLAHALGWDPFPEVPRRRETRATNHRLRLGARELELVQERNQLDLQLYRFARRVFRERLEALHPPRVHEPHRARTAAA